MMKALIVLAAGAAVLQAGAAQAAPVITYTAGPTAGSFTATFGDVPGGNFNDLFTPFTVGTSGGFLSGTLTGFSVLPKSAFKFTTSLVAGPGSFTVPFSLSKTGIFTNGTITSTHIGGGSYALDLAGLGDAGTAFTGTLTFTPTATPEPGTWALMILGFGAIGTAMRRRPARVRVSYANA